MHGGLSAALEEAIVRMDGGADVSVTWLRERHPEHADAVAEALSVQRVLSGRTDGAGGPSRAGAYRVVELLGQGGMGAVYLARSADPAVRPATAAIKVMRPSIAADPRAVARFRREIRAGRRVRHPNVVWTLGGGVERRERPPLWYIVLEYVEGESLRTMLERDGPLPIGMAVRVLTAAARGLAAIHDAGLVHRDVKPENLLMSRDGTLKVADLGVVALTEGPASKAGGSAFAGSPRYAAPEQFVADEQALDGRADLCALGRTMSEMLTGLHPSGETARGCAVHVTDLRSGVPPLLDELIAAMTEPDRRMRPRSAAEVVRILEEGDASPWVVRRRALRRLPADSPLRRALPVEDAAFVERESALDALADAWRGATAGRGGCVFVTGRAGAGKSRLVAEFCLQLGADGAPVHVLHGGFDPGGADPAFGAYRAALARHVQGLTTEEACDAWLASTPALAAPFSRFLREQPAPGDAKLLTRDVLPGAFAEALAGIAKTVPAVLVVEDLHFAGKDAHGVVRSAVAAAADLRLLIVVTSQDAAALPSGATPLSLDRISREGTLTLISEVLGPGSSADRLAGRLAEETDGTPRHVRLVLRHLSGEGRIRRRVNGSWELRRPKASLPVPPGVVELASRALARLGRRDLRLLRTAAVAGLSLDVALLAEAAGREAASVISDLARIERTHGLVCIIRGVATFEQHQVRQVVYDAMPRRTRQALHTQVAEAIERSIRGASDRDETESVAVAVCAHHLRGVDPAVAAPFLIPAVERLELIGRDGEGIDLSRLALRRVRSMTAEQRVRTLTWMAGAITRRDPRRACLYADRAMRVADALGDRALRAAALVVSARARTHSGGNAEAARDALRRAADLARQAGASAIEQSSAVELTQLELHAARLDEAETWAHRAVAIRSGNPESEFSALRSLGSILRFLQRTDEALGVAQLTAEAAGRCRSPLAAAYAAQDLGETLTLRGQLDQAARHLESAGALFRDSGRKISLGNVSVCLSSLYREQGRWMESRDAAVRAAECYRAVRPSDVVTPDVHLALSCVFTGELDRAGRAAGRAVTFAKMNGFAGMLASACQARGVVLLTLGEHEMAVISFEEAAQAYAATSQPEEAAFQGAYVAESLQERGRLEDAEARCRDSLVRQVGTGSVAGVPLTRTRLASILLDRRCLDAADAELRAVLGDPNAASDSDLSFRCSVLRARVAGPGDAAMIAAVRAGLGRSSATSRVGAELALWDLTHDRAHAAGANEALDRLVQSASPKYRESMVASMATYRRVRIIAREAGVGGV